jgi:hypothetical protein
MEIENGGDASGLLFDPSAGPLSSKAILDRSFTSFSSQIGETFDQCESLQLRTSSPPSMWRTNCLDESLHHEATQLLSAQQDLNVHHQSEHSFSDSTPNVNSSFDMSLLQRSQPSTLNGCESSLVPNNSALIRPTASWDELASASAEKRARGNELKPLHNRAHFALDHPELPPTGVSDVAARRHRDNSIRRRTVSNSGCAASSTLVNGSSKGKSTPASAAKRHRIRPRSSPLQLKAPTTPRSVADVTTGTIAGGIRLPELYEPVTVAKKRKPKRSLGTCTTAASTTTTLDEETTMDHSTDRSVDTHDTNFRFTAFPASLPRIHSVHPSIPGHTVHTIRKRMSFGSATTAAAGVASFMPAAPGPNDSQNTSVSSLYQDFYSDDERDNDDESTVQSSILGTPRARLNFNALASTHFASTEARVLNESFLGM